MRFIIHSIAAICALIFLSQCLFRSGDISTLKMHFKEDDKIVAVANGDIKANLKTAGNDELVPLSGRVSLYAETSLKRLENNDIDIKGFNLIFFGVEQKKISGFESVIKKGNLGMSIPLDAKAVTEYNAEDGKVMIKIPVKAHFSQMDEIAGTENTYTTYPWAQNGEVTFHIRFASRKDRSIKSESNEDKSNENKSIEDKSNEDKSIKGKSIEGKSIKLVTTLSSATVEPLDDKRYPPVPGYKIMMNDTTISAQVGGAASLVTKTLCIQRVNIAGSGTIRPTGKGYDIGWNGVETQWGKGGIRFDVRPNWKTLSNVSLRMIRNLDEAAVLRNSFTDDRCVEVFFVHSYFEGGGGRTFSLGLETAKIITSDRIPANNITHLAHEMGHVMGLGESATNELMCPSGSNDNPRKNSWENINAARHALTTFKLSVANGTLRGVGPGPDCNLSQDCGGCPFQANRPR